MLPISDNVGGIEEELIIKDYNSGDIYAKNSQNCAIFTIKLQKV